MPGCDAAAHLVQAAPTVYVSPQGTVVPDALARPLIAGARSVLAFVRVRPCSLRSSRDLDIAGDISVIQIPDSAHRPGTLHAVPGWARPLLTAARAHHRLEFRPGGEGVLAPVLRSGARHLCARVEDLPCLEVACACQSPRSLSSRPSPRSRVGQGDRVQPGPAVWKRTRRPRLVRAAVSASPPPRERAFEALPGRHPRALGVTHPEHRIEKVVRPGWPEPPFPSLDIQRSGSRTHVGRA